MTSRAIGAAAVVVVLVVGAVGCSGEGSTAPAEPTPTVTPTSEPTPSPTSVPDPTPTATAEPSPDPTLIPGSARPADAVTIAAVLERGTTALATVEGFIVVSNGVVRLCTALAESFPPQCAGPSAIVEGLDLETIEDLDSAGPTSWSNEPRYIAGLLVDGHLEVVIIG